MGVSDEPTNHLDILPREILLQALKEITGTIILISHDRHFLQCLVKNVFEINQGKMTIYRGDHEHYLPKTNRDQFLILILSQHLLQHQRRDSHKYL